MPKYSLISQYESLANTRSKNVLDFEDDSRTKNRGRGLGLEEVLPWPNWP